MRVEIRRPVYRGSQLVRALWFDAATLGDVEARRRLLAAWEAGARAYTLNDGYLLEWRQARRMQCELAPGLPLCEQTGVLTSAPLQADERTGIPSGSAVLVRSAYLQSYPLDASARIDPSAWLDMSAIPVYVALDMPTAPHTGFTVSVKEPARDVRALLGEAVPAPSPRRAVFLQQAQAHRSDRARTTAMGTVLGAAAATTGILAALLTLPLRLLPPSGASAPARTGHASPLGDWLAVRLARLAAWTRMSQVLGWRQANYLRRMLQQFDDGNLDEALRHAIPLDSPDLPTRQGFGLWRRRDSLDVGARHSASGIGLDATSIGLLRATYRRSFETLDRAGRIDEAVFVLAELMNRHQEAIDYLERKGRIVQAAQLAETLNLPIAVAVRLHCMAGASDRAVRLARLSNIFGDVVAELERRKHPAAAGLRLEWALDLAARGNLAEAAHAVWPLRDERKRAIDWLHLAEQAGGIPGVQGLVYALALDPQALTSHASTLHALLASQGPEALQQRVRACDCLLQLDTHSGATRRMAGALWRALAAERSGGARAVPSDRLAKLLKLASDPVLSIDAPRDSGKNGPTAVPLTSSTDTLHISFSEHGLYAIEDVRVLPDGGHLLALGEGGIVLARGGDRPHVRFPIPGHKLVLAQNGRRALAVARRERSVRVSRIDLLTNKVDDWFNADLRFWADDYDGATWNVVANERLMALDATVSGQSVLWQVGDLPGAIIGFDQQGDLQALLLSQGSTVEQWRYALPQRRLLGRERLAVPDETVIVLPDCRDDEPMMLATKFADRDRACGVTSLLPEWPATASVHGNLLLLQFERDDGWHCQLMNFDEMVLVEVTLPGAVMAKADVHAGCLMAWDRCGRVVEVHIETGVTRQLTFS